MKKKGSPLVETFRELKVLLGFLKLPGSLESLVPHLQVDRLALLLSVHVEGVEEVLVPLVFLLAGLQLLQGGLGARVKEFTLLRVSGLDRNGNLPKKSLVWRAKCLDEYLYIYIIVQLSKTARKEDSIKSDAAVFQ